MSTFLLDLAQESMVAEESLHQERNELPIPDALIMLGAGNGEFLRGDAPVEQMPGPGLLLCGDAATQIVCVETGNQRFGTNA